MKKLILSLFLMGSLTFGLQSCSDDDDDDTSTDPCENVTCDAGEVCEDGTCVTDASSYTCDECGTYDTEAEGEISAAGLLDSTWTDTNKLVFETVFVQSGSDFILEVDLSNVSALLSTPFEVEGTYDTDSKVFTVTDFETNVANVADVIIDGTADFSTTGEIVGDLQITSPSGAVINVTGDLDFEGDQQ